VIVSSGVLALVATAGACGDSDSADAAPDSGAIESRPIVCDDAALLPTDLRCTGLYSNFGTKQLSPEAREFSPGLSLWSDGASKRRFLSLPPGSQIDTSNMDEWVFPVGTKVWKEFARDGKTIETRLFAKEAPGRWIYTTYVWDKDATRATRLDTGLEGALGTYEIPSKLHCSQCHNGHADRLLGLEAISLGLPAAQGVTLTTLTSEGRLSVPPKATSLTLPGDEKEQRALGYLHVNCGITCHSPNGAGTASFTGMLLRLSAKALLDPDGGAALATETDAYKTTIKMPLASAQFVDDPRYVGFQRIAPGDPDKSLLLAAISARGKNQMPPIVSHEVDTAGVQTLREWIAALPP
jgi:hypothetical protein